MNTFFSQPVKLISLQSDWLLYDPSGDLMNAEPLGPQMLETVECIGYTTQGGAKPGDSLIINGYSHKFNAAFPARYFARLSDLDENTI